ncbi:hypothetical protein ACSBOB_32710 [Mesorhizobium sp. ASY16-5R]|uniref:hypothetical protein n=1 Tax=Mesorhizobium sp. ASY16-5R TaxID=3445772 RepID=UPI003FA096CC
MESGNQKAYFRTDDEIGLRHEGVAAHFACAIDENKVGCATHAIVASIGRPAYRHRSERSAMLVDERSQCCRRHRHQTA